MPAIGRNVMRSLACRPDANKLSFDNEAIIRPGPVADSSLQPSASLSRTTNVDAGHQGRGYGPPRRRGIPYIEAKNGRRSLFCTGLCHGERPALADGPDAAACTGRDGRDIWPIRFSRKTNAGGGLDLAKIAKRESGISDAGAAGGSRLATQGRQRIISRRSMTNSMPVEFKILQYKPTQLVRRPIRSSSARYLSDALSSTWRNDLLRASVQDLRRKSLRT